MSERGGEFMPISSLERSFTVGKVEASVEQKITNLSDKMTENGVFKKENFASEQARDDKFDEMVRLASDNVIDSYRDLIDRSCDETRDQTKINQTFDVLRRASSLTINGDQELQTSLYVGGVKQVLPEVTKYNNGGNTRLDLTKGIVEVTITNPKIRKIYGEVSDIRDSYDFDDPAERKYAYDEIAKQRADLLSLRKEIPAEQRGEWFQAKEYFRMGLGIMSGELNSNDGSADAADEKAVLKGEAKNVDSKVDSSNIEGEKSPGETSELKTDEISKKRTDYGVATAEYEDEEGSQTVKVDLNNPDWKSGDATLNEARTDAARSYREVRELMRYWESIMKSSYKEGGREDERKEVYTLDQIKVMLDDIERSGREVNDIALNSRKFAKLYEISINKHEVIGLPDGLDRDFLSRIIDTRLQLNDRFLMTSKTSTVEDMAKIQTIIHDGDRNKDLDRKFVECLFGGDMEKIGIPFKKAWDLRQKAYFEYFDTQDKDGNWLFGVDRFGYHRGKGMLVAMWNSDEFRQRIMDHYPVDSRKYIETEKKLVSKLAEINKGKKKWERKDNGPITREEVVKKIFLDTEEIMMHKSPEKYGIYKDYYTNLRCEIDPFKRALVEDFMIDLLRKDLDTGTEVFTEDQAKKAEELAAKAANVLWMDSLANIAQADGDGLAEMFLYKFLKYEDAAETDGGKAPKNKDAGAYDIIKYIDRLAPSFLEVASTDEAKEKRHLWMGVMADEVDPGKIGAKSDMLYLTMSIFMKKTLPTQGYLSKGQAAKDILGAPNLRAINDRMNKAMDEAEAAGVHVLDARATKLSAEEDAIMDKKSNKVYKEMRRRLFRSYAAMGWVQLMSETKFTEFDTVRKVDDFYDLLTGNYFLDKNQEWNNSFIDKKQVGFIEDRYRLRKIVQLREDAEKRKKFKM